MTDWERVGRLRGKGASWDEIANDERVGFHPSAGTESGRALKSLYYRRKSAAGASRHPGPETPLSSGIRFGGAGMSRGHWAALGAGVSVLAAVILVLVYVLPAANPPSPGSTMGPGSIGSMDRFSYLSQQHSDACHWQGVNLGDQTANLNWINGLPEGTFLQGACCSPMDFPDYSNQTTGLKAYSSNPLLAPDPYNMPSHTAKADAAGVNLALSTDQQSTLSTASSMTKDNGWCCCQCWAYYAHEGLAKQLIVQNGFNAQQVVAAINLEDCCGGPGPMNM